MIIAEYTNTKYIHNIHTGLLNNILYKKCDLSGILCAKIQCDVNPDINYFRVNIHVIKRNES